MTLTNHLLTGAVLAKFLPLPVAVPLAFASHFILDALPHFGYPKVDGLNVIQKHNKAYLTVTAVDVLLAILLVTWLVSSHHARWALVGLVAYSPDLLWVYRFCVQEKFGKVEPTRGNWFIQFHRNIQKYERVWGIGVEIVYGAVIFSLVR